MFTGISALLGDKLSWWCLGNEHWDTGTSPGSFVFTFRYRKITDKFQKSLKLKIIQYFLRPKCYRIILMSEPENKGIWYLKS